MWNFWKESSVAPLQPHPRRRSLQLAVAVAHLVTVAGCGHSIDGRRMNDRTHTVASITADQLFSVGLHYAGRGDLQRAEQYLNAARKQGYEEATVVFWLIRVCIAAGRYHSALGHAVSYLRAHPDDWSLRLVVASIHEALGDWESARSELETIVREEPNRALAHYRLAMLHSEQQSPQALVRQHLQQYLRLEPDGPHGPEAAAALEELEGRRQDLDLVSLSDVGQAPEEAGLVPEVGP
jgi:tetratricopeptide (TPR) repeat protein